MPPQYQLAGRVAIIGFTDERGAGKDATHFVTSMYEKDVRVYPWLGSSEMNPALPKVLTRYLDTETRSLLLGPAGPTVAGASAPAGSASTAASARVDPDNVRVITDPAVVRSCKYLGATSSTSGLGAGMAKEAAQNTEKAMKKQAANLGANTLFVTAAGAHASGEAYACPK
jgi:hypothetical protein